MSVVKQSAVDMAERVDAQFFRKTYLSEDVALGRHEIDRIGAHAKVTDGPHGYHEVDEDSPIAMLTAKSAANWFATRDRADTISAATHAANMRSALEANDVILGTRGTVGRCALVTGEVLPANIDQDVARITLVSGACWLPEFLTAYLNCRFGQDHVERHSTGMVQQGISLAKVRDIPVPILERSFQNCVKCLVLDAKKALDQRANLFHEAETVLLDALGLRNWSPPEPLTYTRPALSLPSNKRLDAEFSAPKVQALLERLSRTGTFVGSVANVRREQFRPRPPGSFRYIEIGDLDGFGRCGSSEVNLSEAPSRATWHVRAGDVLTSTVRPLRRLSAIVAPDQDRYVCSSGFVVLNPVEVSPELLMTYLRLPMVCELMHLFATASMYPALSEADLLALPMPNVAEELDSSVQQLVRESARQLEHSERLLGAAKRAVEIAIEKDEAAALSFIAGQEEGTNASCA